MIRAFLIGLAILVCFAAPCIAAGQPPIPRGRIGRDADLWAARSCIGEAGWRSWQGECAAILWVYKSRYEAMRPSRPDLTYAKVIRRYSSAVKPHTRHGRPWLFELRSYLDRPPSWPASSSWRLHRSDWARVVGTVRRWLRGDVENPCPGARHYGNRTTDGRPTGHILAQCAVETRNRFWGRP